MMRNLKLLLVVFLFALSPRLARAIERPDVVFKVFQFPADKIPRIDGNTNDWDVVPEDYVIGTDQLADTENGNKVDPKKLDVRVKVGWVKGLNRLYFLYEANKDYWDFSHDDLHNDIFEVVVDGDASGGPLIADMHPNKKLDYWDAYFSMQSVHAQNYHIFTPALDKDWAMVWGCQTWLKHLPWANAAYAYNFKPGEGGKLVLEFWITPFDHASCDGPVHSVESSLQENKLIGLSWSILDYHDVNATKVKGFYNLSHKTTMYGNANDLVMFKLMPLDAKFHKAIEAHWSFQIVDMDRRLVAFRDESYGKVTSWKWDFGDKTTSADQNPMHTYQKAGMYVVTLYVQGPDGSTKLTKVWDVVVR